MFAGIIFICSFLNSESPRYLIKRGKHEKATSTLARIRGLSASHEVVVREIAEIQHQLDEEEAATQGVGFKAYVREIFCLPNNFYRVYLGLGSQLLSQWSGAQSITIYCPEIMAMVGVHGQNQKLYATAIFGVVKFVAAIICAFWLVDVIGRKRSLGWGISLQAIAMGYIACFLTIIPQLEKGQSFTSSQKAASTGAIVMIYVSGKYTSEFCFS